MKTKLLLLLFLLHFSSFAQTNLVPNGNFETWSSSSQPDNWYPYFSGLVSQSAVAQNGTSSTNMMVASGTSNFINSEYFPVTAGKTYKVTLYHRAVKGTFSSIDLSLYHKPSTFKSVIIKKSDATFSTTEWRKIEFEYTPTVSESIEVDIWTYGTLNSEILVDNVSVVDIADVPVQYTLIPDINFEKKLIALNIDSGTPDGKVPTNKINKVTNLDVSYSSITDLTGIEDFVALTSFYTLQNKLVTLDVSKNVNLTILRCDSNTTIETLNVSQNTKLTQLLCGNNKIKSLNLSQLTDLRELYCDQNQLTAIDLSTNAKLEKLYINDNQLTKLDLTKNPTLKYLNCKYNRPMSELNLKNGKNTLIDKNSFYATENTSLTCILVDNVAYSNTNWTTGKDVSVDFSLVCSEPEYTLIPDVEFEKKLVSNGLDLILDGKVLTRKIAAAQYLYLENAPITDLTGLEVFTSLKKLSCFNIKAKSINVSKNTQLTALDCSANNLETIDVTALVNLKELNLSSNNLTTINLSKNQALTDLYLSKNKLTEINLSANKALISINFNNNPLNQINVSENPALKYLNCTDVLTTSLDLTKNPDLQFIDIERSEITSLDLTKNPELSTLNSSQTSITSLNLSNNKKLTTLKTYGSYWSSGNGGAGSLTSLDLSNNVLLTHLDCGANQLTKLDLSANTKLEYVRCYGNLITDLDLSKNTEIVELSCNDNKLKSLNLKNGANSKIKTIQFALNPSLSCVQVDDIAYSSTNWTKKDVTANFSSDCAYTTLIPDVKFEEKLIALGIDTGAKDGKVLTANITSLTSLDVSTSGITDLTGISDFINLESLTVSDNNLNKIDVSKNFKLTSLNVGKNQLTQVNLSNNKNLQAFYCNDNLLTSLDLSKNKKLISVSCTNNKLISLNLKNGNNIASDGVGIRNFTSNPDLKCIQVDDETYANTKWVSFKDANAGYSSNCEYATAIPDPKFEDKLIALGIDSGVKDGKVATANIIDITSLNVDKSEISDLTGIQDFISLKALSARNNAIKNVDVSKNTELTSLDVYGNNLTTIDVAKNTLLKKLFTGNNSISSINITNNIALTHLTFELTRIETIDLSQNKNLLYLDCTNSPLKSLDISKNPQVYYLNCQYNQLEKLNLKNGNNTLMSTNNVAFYGNSKLYCILVDDVNYANTNWSNKKSSIATFNTECTGELNLPANNFTVETKGESCTGENNGEISIVGKNSFAYVATINDKSYAFTNNSLKVTSLTPGTYKIKITIPEMIFEQNFTVTIPKGANISGKSSITSKNVAVEITEGTAPFTVFVDGTEQFQTIDSNFNINLEKGGLIEVATAKACEGTFSKKVSSAEIGTVLSAYPNPTSDAIEIEIPTDKTEVIIELFSFGGQLVSRGTYNIENGRVVLNLAHQPAGIYAAKIHLETLEYIKIIKK
ncbi:T9SS type A sorting domain-containing protein [Flavobacterium sp. N2038]|uniref:T9SS type A sorting domain-containing protein n=1 Tax=Flavobacterium sp. N2038 TaxID=2986829 RepID=UPI002224F9CD|nr:T9SS type A sorting domain-containing protein [Flavobacterium sp. N2038]